MRKLLILCTIIVQTICAPNGCVELCPDANQAASNYGSYQSYNIQSSYNKEMDRISTSDHNGRLEDLGVQNHIVPEKPGNWSKVDSYVTDNGHGRVFQEHGQVVNGPRTVKYFSKNYTSSWGTGGGVPSMSSRFSDGHHFEKELQKLRSEISTFGRNFHQGSAMMRTAVDSNDEFNRQVEMIRGQLNDFCSQTTQSGALHSNGINMSEDFEREVQRIRNEMSRWSSQNHHAANAHIGASQSMVGAGHEGGDILTSSSGYTKEERHHITMVNGVPAQIPSQVPSQEYRYGAAQHREESVTRNSDATRGHPSSHGDYAQSSTHERNYGQTTSRDRNQQYVAPTYDAGTTVDQQQAIERHAANSRRQNQQQYVAPAYNSGASTVNEHTVERHASSSRGGSQQYVAPTYHTSGTVDEQTLERHTANSRGENQQYAAPTYDARVTVDQQAIGRQTNYRGQNQQYVAPATYDTGVTAVDQQVIERHASSSRGQNQQYVVPAHGSRTSVDQQTVERAHQESRNEHIESSQRQAANVGYGHRAYNTENYAASSQPVRQITGYESKWNSETVRKDESAPQYTNTGYNTYEQQRMQQRQQQQHLQNQQAGYHPGQTHSTYTEETNERQVKKALTTHDNQLVHGLINMDQGWEKDGSSVQTVREIDCDTAEKLVSENQQRASPYRRYKRHSGKYYESEDLNQRAGQFEDLTQQSEDLTQQSQDYSQQQNGRYLDLSQQSRNFEFGQAQKIRNLDLNQRTDGGLEFGHGSSGPRNEGFTQQKSQDLRQAARPQAGDQFNQQAEVLNNEASLKLDSMLEHQSRRISKPESFQGNGHDTRYGQFDQQQTQTVSKPERFGVPSQTVTSDISHAQWQIDGSSQKIANAPQTVSGHNENSNLERNPSGWQVERLPQRNDDFSQQASSNFEQAAGFDQYEQSNSRDVWPAVNEGKLEANQDQLPAATVRPLSKPAPKPSPRYTMPWKVGPVANPTQTEKSTNNQPQTDSGDTEVEVVNTRIQRVNFDKDSRGLRVDHNEVDSYASTVPSLERPNYQRRTDSALAEDNFSQQTQQSGHSNTNNYPLNSFKEESNDQAYQHQQTGGTFEFGSQSQSSQRPMGREMGDLRYGSSSIGEIDDLMGRENKEKPAVSFQPRILEAYGSRGPYNPSHSEDVFEHIKPNPAATLPPFYEGDPWYIQVRREEEIPSERVVPLEEATRQPWLQGTTSENPSIWSRIGHKITSSYDKAKEKAKVIFG